MPIPIAHTSPTLFIRKRAFAQHALARADFDVILHLTVDEFRVEGELVAIGPVYDAEALAVVIADLERRGLVYFEGFFRTERQLARSGCCCSPWRSASRSRIRRPADRG